MAIGYFPAPTATLKEALGHWYLAQGIAVNPAAAIGDVITAGSSTVYPLSQRMAELYQNEGGGTVTVDSIGSGAGFERFCKTGETDIANASRAIKPEEIDNCKAIGREPIEFRVGTDALAVVISAENTFIDYLTIAELATAYSTATTWADVRAGWPAEAIQRYSPGTDSGTFDYFVEAVMRPVYGQDNSADKNAILNSEGTQFSENDATLVAGVEGSPNAIGYFGYAYYAAEGGKLKAVPVVPAKVETPSLEAAVSPSDASVNAGTYPLARPLFLYSDAQIMADKPQVAAFIGFYLQHVEEEIAAIGYFPAPTAALGNSVASWLEALNLLPSLEM
jgi:phosphate binding protein